MNNKERTIMKIIYENSFGEKGGVTTGDIAEKLDSEDKKRISYPDPIGQRRLQETLALMKKDYEFNESVTCTRQKYKYDIKKDEMNLGPELFFEYFVSQIEKHAFKGFIKTNYKILFDAIKGRYPCKFIRHISKKYSETEVEVEEETEDSWEDEVEIKHTYGFINKIDFKDFSLDPYMETMEFDDDGVLVMRKVSFDEFVNIDLWRWDKSDELTESLDKVAEKLEGHTFKKPCIFELDLDLKRTDKDLARVLIEDFTKDVPCKKSRTVKGDEEVMKIIIAATEDKFEDLTSHSRCYLPSFEESGLLQIKKIEIKDNEDSARDAHLKSLKVLMKEFIDTMWSEDRTKANTWRILGELVRGNEKLSDIFEGYNLENVLYKYQEEKIAGSKPKYDCARSEEDDETMNKKILSPDDEYNRLVNLLKKTWKKTDKEMDEIFNEISLKGFIYVGWLGLSDDYPINENEFIDEVSSFVDLMCVGTFEVSSSYLEGKKLEERRKLIKYLNDSNLVMLNMGFIVEGENVRVFSYEHTRGVTHEEILEYNSKDNSLVLKENKFSEEDREKLASILERNKKFLIKEIKKRKEEK